MAEGQAVVTVGVGASGAVTTETVECVTPTLPSTPSGGEGNLVRFTADFPNAVATAVITIKLYQGTTTSGTLIRTFGPYTVGTAAAGALLSGSWLDKTAAAAGVANYCISVTGSGGTTGTGAKYVLEVAPAGIDA